jgi:hypothetical protein
MIRAMAERTGRLGRFRRGFDMALRYTIKVETEVYVHDEDMTTVIRTEHRTQFGEGKLAYATSAERNISDYVRQQIEGLNGG